MQARYKIQDYCRDMQRANISEKYLRAIHAWMKLPKNQYKTITIHVPTHI